MTIIELQEYEKLPPRKGVKLDPKKINTVKQLESLTLLDEDTRLKQELEEKKILTISSDPIKKGLVIEATSHIGVAQFSKFTVTISPKFSNLKKIIELINYVYELDLEIFPQSEIEFEGAQNLLSEIIISTFLKKYHSLIKQGLAKSYNQNFDNIAYLRGKLILSKQIINDTKNNMQFACEYDELEYNNIENQILLFCLERCYYITINEQRKQEIRSLLHTLTGLIEKKEISLEDFKKINYNQMNNHYKKTHEICKLIVQNVRITDFYSRKTRFVNSFFIDMNQVFEKFVFKLFNEYYQLPCKEQQHYASWLMEKSKKSFDIIVDILIYDKTRKNIESIIDTKYKDSLSEQDRFQIAHYIRDYGKTEGIAILPKTANSISDSIIAPRQGIKIKIHYIDIDRILELLYSDSKTRKYDIYSELTMLITPGR